MKKVGLIGAGTMGERYLRSFAMDPLAEIVAVCELDEAKGRALGGKFGIESYYSDVQEMIQAESLDAVIVATPDFAHKKATLVALAAGVHVLCEKPLATSVEDAVEMVLAEQASAGSLMVNFGNRHRPSAIRAREALSAGQIGTPRYAYMALNETAGKTATLAWSAQTSPLWFLLSHVTDFLQWMLDDEVVSVYASNGKADSIETTTLGVLNFRSGATGIMESTWDMPSSYQRPIDLRLSVHGQTGVIDLDMGDQGLILTDQDKSGSIQWDTTAGFTADDWWNRSCFYFSKSITEGTELQPSAKQGLATVLVLSALQKSLDTGAAVTIAAEWPEAVELLR